MNLKVVFNRVEIIFVRESLEIILLIKKNIRKAIK